MSYLLVVTVKVGICGETKRPQITSLRGTLTKTTPCNEHAQIEAKKKLDELAESSASSFSAFWQRGVTDLMYQMEREKSK